MWHIFLVVLEFLRLKRPARWWFILVHNRPKSETPDEFFDGLSEDQLEEWDATSPDSPFIYHLIVQASCPREAHRLIIEKMKKENPLENDFYEQYFSRLDFFIHVVRMNDVGLFGPFASREEAEHPMAVILGPRNPK